MSSHVLRIGLVGGLGHTVKFGRLINSFPESMTAVIWDTDEERGQKNAAELNIPFEPDYERVINDYHLDAAVITAENALHRQLCVKAADKGISLFVEKPLSVVPQEAYDVRDAVNRNHIKFYMSDPFIRSADFAIMNMIREGILGKITGATFRIGSNAVLENLALLDRNRMMGGIMADIGGHMLHKAYYFFGRPEAVKSVMTSWSDGAKNNNVEDNMIAILEYPGGVLVSMECSWIDGGEASYEAVYGSKGSALAIRNSDAAGKDSVTLLTGRRIEHEIPEDQIPDNPTQHIRYFIRMLSEDLPNDIVGQDPKSNSGVSIDHAVEYAEIIDAIYRAAEAGGEIRL
ncbi:MAG: Gfo/Idh/MocA family oxidoreductase [Lachnospiraceae bacterium]|nr:Gfo/Idh/MocA family oxidoreductase [Lachnospiraceae bacterium]